MGFFFSFDDDFALFNCFLANFVVLDAILDKYDSDFGFLVVLLVRSDDENDAAGGFLRTETESFFLDTGELVSTTTSSGPATIATFESSSIVTFLVFDTVAVGGTLKSCCRDLLEEGEALTEALNDLIAMRA